MSCGVGLVRWRGVGMWVAFDVGCCKGSVCASFSGVVVSTDQNSQSSNHWPSLCLHNG